MRSTRPATLLLLTAVTGCPQGSFTLPETGSGTGSGTQDPTTAPSLCNLDAACDPTETPSNCPEDCSSPPSCGDGTVDADEQCDDGPDNGDTYAPLKRCNATCTGLAPHCGDAQCQITDESPDSCPTDCSVICGDGQVTGDEPCDDGNDIETDACLPGCILATCGDGFVHATVEACDDANADETDNCVACELARCGDGSVHAGVESCDDGNPINDDDCSNACQPPRRVFATSLTYDGALGGLTGADQRCQKLADAASLTGTYLAWLSDDTGSPATRFDTTFTGAYQRVDGTVIASDGWPDLTDGELAHSVFLDETGTGFLDGTVWTNTRPDGALLSLTKHCDSWTSKLDQGLNTPALGDPYRTDAQWTQAGSGACHVATKHLYCFEN
jgi:cysteine-rich repeat protein